MGRMKSWLMDQEERGVEVDVEVPAAPMDYLVGGSDTVLEAGIERILESLDGP